MKEIGSTPEAALHEANSTDVTASVVSISVLGPKQTIWRMCEMPKAQL